MNRKIIKKQAWAAMRRHYILFTVLALALALLGTKFAATIVLLGENPVVKGVYDSGRLSSNDGLSDVTSLILEDRIDEGSERAEEIKNEMEADDKGIIAHKNGVLAEAVNNITSGGFLVKIAISLRNIFNSSYVAIRIILIVTILLIVIWWAFIKNPALVVATRIYLEGRVYRCIPASRFLFLITTKKWFKVSLALLRWKIYSFFWWLTIVGGFIKHYSYFLVPYILAENPNITGKEAIGLSRKLMYGYKWQCFILELSMIGWYILGIITMSASDLFFTNAYRMSVYSQFYATVRKKYLMSHEMMTEYFNDRCLFEIQPSEILSDVYPESVDDIKPFVYSGKVRGFFSNVFGIAVREDREEEEWKKNQTERLKKARHHLERTGSSYPNRLSPLQIMKSDDRFGNTPAYLRHYSSLSLVLIFFIFSMAGWIWEVLLHIAMDGTFVNRGVLLGPWLPVYGSGCLLILMCLYRFRSKPALEFCSIIILCGVVEYSTALILELTHDGMRWWNYNGYFLNLQGRVCAEGLLVFAIGGMVLIYYLAPRIDDLILRLPKKAFATIAVILIIVFSVDTVHSMFNPNMGEGITSGGKPSVNQSQEVDTSR